MTPDKKASQKIGLRLRNLLKLPKAHKWCIYEWFYSNIDRPLFEGDNEFCLCLKESFPNLKTRKLTRVEWGTIRRLMGKPRRYAVLLVFSKRKSTSLFKWRSRHGFWYRFQVLLGFFCGGTNSFAAEEAENASAAAGKDFWHVELQRPSRWNPSETQHRNKSYW